MFVKKRSKTVVRQPNKRHRAGFAREGSEVRGFRRSPRCKDRANGHRAGSAREGSGFAAADEVRARQPSERTPSGLRTRGERPGKTYLSNYK